MSADPVKTATMISPAIPGGEIQSVTAASPRKVVGEGLAQGRLLSSARGRNLLRKVHALIGVVGALNLLLLVATGFVLQHRELFRLEDRTVSRAFLLQSYRAQDGPDGVRADIVVTDLHSGRLFGRTGALVLDAVSLAWVALLASGLVMYTFGRRRREACPVGEDCDAKGNGRH
jgi:uncharacterized iron-regulated membrane protein